MGNANAYLQGNLAGAFSGFGSAIENLGQGVMDLPSYIWNQFETGFNTGQAIMTDIKNSVTGLLQPILTKIDTMTGGLITKIGTIPDGIYELFRVPIEGIGWLLNSIFEGINSIFEVLETIPSLFVQIISYLDPFSPNFILTIAFVPQGDYDDEIKSAFDNKFGDLITVFTMFDSLKNREWDNEAPTFEITVPQKYGGGTHNIIDFSFYGQYRDFIHTFTIMTATFFFFIKIIHILPKIV